MAKRCLVVSNKIVVDSKSNDRLLYLVLYRLPNRTKNGGLWYPKSTESVVNVCVNEKREPEKFSRLSTFAYGSCVDISFGLNENTEKTYVASVELVPNTSFLKDDVLFI